MTILLDTSVIIDTLRRRHGRYELLQKLLNQGHYLSCCTISVVEVYAGMWPQEAGTTERSFQGLECIEITWDIARRAGTLKYEWGVKGRTLHIPDVVVAAVAMSLGLTLATDNTKDFPMPELNLLPMDRD